MMGQAEPFSPHEYPPVPVDLMRRVLQSMATGESVWGAAVTATEIANHQSVDDMAAVIKRVQALSNLVRGDLNGCTGAAVAAASVCRCTAPWTQPGAPRFDGQEFRDAVLGVQARTTRQEDAADE